MKRLVVNLTAFFIIGMGGLTLLQPSQSVASPSMMLMAECEDEHGDMEGDVCGRDENGNCWCADYPE